MDQITFEYRQVFSRGILNNRYKLQWRRDQSNRTHQIRAHIPTDYPLSAPMLTTDLPCQPPALLSTSLSDNIRHIHSIITDYKDFFECMDELDSHCRILDPDSPRAGDAWRRVALYRHCSVHIDINPDSPRNIPRARFFGAEKRAGELRITWKQAPHVWDTSLTPFVNMKRLLKEAFVDLSKPQEERHRNEVECGICYAYKLDQSVQETPDVVCPNELCNKGFHPTCLYEWLRSSPESTRSFNVLFGKCPYCGEVKIFFCFDFKKKKYEGFFYCECGCLNE
ncbi:FANCL C-terminal domain-containing protein [Phycomyces nitens]|nr:FANCL C-terminal domain-containing protein [Phycomyces nitens]